MEKVSKALIHSNQMLSLSAVSLFTRVKTYESISVVQDKLAAYPSFEEHTCIPIDNLMHMLTFCVNTIYFKRASDSQTRSTGYGIGGVTSIV